jgi:multidrug efflux system membrane fusion protein
MDGERVAVTAGLTVGDTVVTEGGDRLREGAAVQLPTDAPTTPANAQPSAAKKSGAQPGAHHRQHAAPSP